MTVGVYAIICTVTNKRYIGSSRRSIENRFSNHLSTLKKGAHYNAELQADYNALGPANFECKILVECSAAVVLAEEQYRIDYWKARNKCYNVHPNARSALGTKYTEDQKRRQAVSAKNRCTPEWCAAVSERVKAQHKAGKFGRRTWRKK